MWLAENPTTVYDLTMSSLVSRCSTATRQNLSEFKQYNPLHHKSPAEVLQFLKWYMLT